MYGDDRQLTLSEKRLVLKAALIGSLLAAGAAVFIDAFSTYRFLEKPTIQELVGILLIGLLIACLSLFYLVWKIPEENLKDQNPLPNFPLLLLAVIACAFITSVDHLLFDSYLIAAVSEMTDDHETVFSLLFSGLLIILYFDLHRTQQRQTEIMNRQSQLEMERAEWQRTRRSPRVDPQSWKIIDIGDPQEDSRQGSASASEEYSQNNLTEAQRRAIEGVKPKSMFTLLLENDGNSEARNLTVDTELYVSGPELPDGFHQLPFILFFVRPSHLHEVDRKDGKEQWSATTTRLKQGEIKPFAGAIRWYSNDWADNSVETFGDAMRLLPIDISTVIIRFRIRYEDLTGDEHRRRIGAVQVATENISTFGKLAEDGTKIGYDMFNQANSDYLQDLVEDRFYSHQEQTGRGSWTLHFDFDNRDSDGETKFRRDT